MADPRTLHIRQGQTYRGQFTWTDSGGDPVSLAGFTARFRLLKRAGGAVQLEVLSTDGVTADGTVAVEPSGSTGEITVRLTAQQTAGLKRDCVYALDVLDPRDGTEVDNVSSGPVTLTLAGA